MKPLWIVVLWALPALAGDQAPVPNYACGADSVKFKVTSKGRQAAAQPEPGKALIYVVEDFLRPGNELGRPTIRVGLDGNWVGANRGTSYISFNVEPGEHHLCTDWQSVPPWLPKIHPAAAGVAAESGQTYYFRARLMETYGYFTLDLDRVNADEGRILVATSPASEYRVKK